MDKRTFLKLGVGAAIGTMLPEAPLAFPDQPIIPQYNAEMVKSYSCATNHRITVPKTLDECYELMPKEVLHEMLREQVGFIRALQKKQEEQIFRSMV